MMTRAGSQPHATDEAKVPRDSASQVTRATTGLREQILRGAFKAGQRIAEIPLSAKLGVSRTPLRLAFEKLEHEGLIKALPHSGFAVNEFGIEDVWEAIEARGILEGAAARLAAERLKNPAQLEPLRKYNRAMEDILTLDIEKSEEYLNLNEDFHAAILELAENQVLKRSTEQVYRLPFGSPRALVLVNKMAPASKQIMPIAQEHHRAIVDAIEHRQGARAEGVAREHARLSRVGLELALSNKNLMEVVPGAHLITNSKAARG